MEAHLTSNKLIFLQDLLDSWLSKHTARLHEVQELVGFLQFASQVILHSHSFIRRLINFSMTFTSPFTSCHILAYATANILWWWTFTFMWNGVRLIQPTQATVHVYTDARGCKGLRGVFGPHWFSSHVPFQFRDHDIQFKEIYAILQAILCWGTSGPITMSYFMLITWP